MSKTYDPKDPDYIWMKKWAEEVKMSTPKNKDEMIERYDKLAPTFDKDAAKFDYVGPEMAADKVNEFSNALGIPKDANVLDLLCGTGAVGQIMSDKHGFTNIDGLDASPKSLDVLKEKGCHQDILMHWIEDHIPVSDGTYDIVAIAGGVCPSHMEIQHVPLIIRIIRDGGLFINVMRHDYLPEMGLEEACKMLETQGKWKCLENSIHETKYYEYYDAYIQVYQITK